MNAQTEASVSPTRRSETPPTRDYGRRVLGQVSGLFVWGGFETFARTGSICAEHNE
jgi:hypothetical protein